MCKSRKSIAVLQIERTKKGAIEAIDFVDYIDNWDVQQFYLVPVKKPKKKRGEEVNVKIVIELNYESEKVPSVLEVKDAITVIGLDGEHKKGIDLKVIKIQADYLWENEE